MGIGPECRQHIDGGIDNADRELANEMVFNAAIAAQTGHVAAVMAIAAEIEQLGLKTLADKVRRRFKKAVTRKADITITVHGDYFKVVTPYRRKGSKEFVAAWRAIPGRRFRDRANFIPMTQKTALWELLREFFAGKYGKGPKGMFRIPKPEPKLVQAELSMA
jgi:hypothetical protein